MNLNKQQAVEAMKAGRKVTHDLFSPHDWVTGRGNFIIQTEEGYEIPAVEFWRYRQGENFETGWRIWGE